jgi:hypothetical protein
MRINFSSTILVEISYKYPQIPYDKYFICYELQTRQRWEIEFTSDKFKVVEVCASGIETQKWGRK